MHPARRFIPLSLLLLAAGACAAASSTAAPADQLRPTQLYLWNRSGEQTRLTIRIDNRTIFDDTLNSASGPCSIQWSRVLHLNEGGHEVSARSRRGGTATAAVNLDAGGPDIGIAVVSPAGVAIILAYNAALAELTPGCAANP